MSTTVSPSPPAAGPSADWTPPAGMKAILGSLMLAMLLAALDQTIVSTALPVITSDLGGLAQMAWVTTAYLLASTAFAPLWGKAGDLYGHKRMLQASIVVFLAGSLIAGAATTMEAMIAGRAVQGLGGGGLMVLVMSVISDLVPARHRGRYAGVFGSVFGLASVIGPLAGGWFTESLSWRWAFYINVPLGIVAMIVLGAKLHTHERHTTNVRLDWIGAALLVPAASSLLLALEWAGSGEYGWTSWQILALFTAAAVLTAGFVVWELRTPDPLVPLRMFTNRTVNLAAAVAFVTGFAMFGGLMFAPLLLQVVHGMGPTEAGLAMLPMTAGMMITSITSGRMISTSGRYKPWPIAGTALLTTAMGLLATTGTHTPYWQIAAMVFLLGLGLGCIMQVTVLIIQNAAPKNMLGAATSSATFVRSIGASIGTAAFGAVFNHSLAERMPAGAGEQSGQGGFMTVLEQLPPQAKTMVVDAFSGAIGQAFLFAVPFAAVAFVLAALVPQKPLHTGHTPPAAD
jgi:EmrB/QacA subfamily drug resistance transporter